MDKKSISASGMGISASVTGIFTSVTGISTSVTGILSPHLEHYAFTPVKG